MNDFQKPIRRRDPASYEEIRIDAIEKDKKRKEEQPKAFPSANPKPLVFGSLVSYFKKFLDALFPKEEPPLLFFDQRQMLEDVATFQKLLHTLTREDKSHNPEYTQHLSEVWHNLLGDCNSILAASDSAPSALIKLKIFVNELLHFPPGEDHSLGYYFSAYAGKDWIPFPFMEMLQQLHEECAKNPQKALLIKWLDALTDILSSAGYKNQQDD